MNKRTLHALIRWCIASLSHYHGKHCNISIDLFFSMAHVKKYGQPITPAGWVQLKSCINRYKTTGEIPFFVEEYVKNEIIPEFVIENGEKRKQPGKLRWYQIKIVKKTP